MEKNEEARAVYDGAMADITKALQKLEALGIPREDCGMLLPLGMESKVVLRTNLRNLIDMSHQRLCTRAYWEYRDLMRDLMEGTVFLLRGVEDPGGHLLRSQMRRHRVLHGSQVLRTPP